MYHRKFFDEQKYSYFKNVILGIHLYNIQSYQRLKHNEKIKPVDVKTG